MGTTAKQEDLGDLGDIRKSQESYIEYYNDALITVIRRRAQLKVTFINPLGFDPDTIFEVLNLFSMQQHEVTQRVACLSTWQ